MLHQTFLAIIIFYQFALALRDYIITGVLAKGLPPDGRFHAYVLITSLEVTALAALAAFTEPTWYIQLLKVWTVYLTWFGGGLDWIYFVAIGKIPDANFVWNWMPFSPTTRHWIVYTALMWIPCVICWILVLT